MAASDHLEKPEAEVKQPQPAGEPDKQPCGTMFDPETIRKFIEQQKKENK